MNLSPPSSNDMSDEPRTVTDFIEAGNRPIHSQNPSPTFIYHEDLGLTPQNLTQINIAITQYPNAIAPSSQNFDRHVSAKKSLLASITSHLKPGKLSVRLSPGCWRPIYLTALNITVRTGVKCTPDWTSVAYDQDRVDKQRRSILSARANIRSKFPRDRRLYRKLSTTVAKGYKPKAPIGTDDGLLVAISELCKTEFSENTNGASLLYMITTYLLIYVTEDLSKKAWLSINTDRRLPNFILQLKYGKHNVLFSPKLCLCSKPPFGLIPSPMLAVITWNHHVSHYARETAYLLAFAQHHFERNAKVGEETYQPYVIALRRTTRASIVTAVISRGYLDSIERKDPESLEVFVSEEFDLAVGSERKRFLEVYAELVTGVVTRDERAGKGGFDTREKVVCRKRKRSDEVEGDRRKQVRMQKEEMVEVAIEEAVKNNEPEVDPWTLENGRLSEEMEVEVDKWQ